MCFIRRKQHSAVGAHDRVHGPARFLCVVFGGGGKTNGLSPLDAPSVSEFLRIFIVDASSVELVLASRRRLVKLLGVSE